MTQIKKGALLTHGPIISTLIKLTLPMIAGTVAFMAFNLIDTYFVGQLSAQDLAAMSFTFPVIMTVLSMSFGLGVGTTALVSRALGGNQPDKAKRLTTDSLILSVVIVLVIAVIGIFTIDPLFSRLGADAPILALIRKYMVIWYIGVPFLVVPMVGNAAIRATGDTRTPATIMILGVVINTVLDPLLIFGLGPFPRLELAGAAIATVFSRSITFLLAIWVLYYREKMLILRLPAVGEFFASLKQILYIGLPVSGTQMIVPLTTGYITRLVAGFGTEAVAAYGVASRIDLFAIIIVMALTTALNPFIGQNLGAKAFDRVRQAVWYSQSFAFLWGIGMLILFLFIRFPISRLFNDDQTVIATLALYLSIVPISYGLQGVIRICNITLNVLGKPIHATAISLFQMFILYIPLALLGASLYGLSGIFLAAAVANILTGVGIYFWLRWHLGRLEVTHTAVPSMPGMARKKAGTLPS